MTLNKDARIGQSVYRMPPIGPGDKCDLRALVDDPRFGSFGF